MQRQSLHKLGKREEEREVDGWTGRLGMKRESFRFSG